MQKKTTPPPVVTYPVLVGKVVAQFRERSRSKQGEFAAAIGLSQSAYSRLESGDSVMNVAQLRNIATQLEIEPSQILARADAYEEELHKQGVKVVSEKPTDAGAALVIGLGLLAALLMSSR